MYQTVGEAVEPRILHLIVTEKIYNQGISCFR